MSSKLEGILLLSDLDGTLIDKNFKIPIRNGRSIEKFKNNGGYFCIASGRSMESGKRYIDQIKPNVPCILMNGAVIYDFNKRRIIWDCPMPKQTLDYVRIIRNRFSGVGIELYADEEIYLINSEYYVKKHLKNENLDLPICSLENIGRKINKVYKVLFAMNCGVMKTFKAFVDSLLFEGVRFVETSDNYCEMISIKTNKGYAALKLIDFLNIDKNKTYAIGDHYNDIEMINSVFIGAATAGAKTKVQKFANLILGSCENGAVADLIEYIEKN